MNGNNDPFSTDLESINYQTPRDRVFLIYYNVIVAFLAQANSTTIPIVVNTSIFNSIRILSERFDSANNNRKSHLIIVARIIHEYVTNFAHYVNNDNNIEKFSINYDDNIVIFSIEFNDIIIYSIFTYRLNPSG
jgi:hypothetical protein